MSKIFSFLLILLLQLGVFPFQAFASADCSSDDVGNISYEPKTFPPPTGTLTLNFTINNNNAYNSLKGKVVRLHYIVPLARAFGDYNTPEVTIPTDKKSFSIPLTGDGKMTSPGPHEAVLDLVVGTTVLGNNRHEEYCKGIKYIVGDPNICVIDPKLPVEIPPLTPLTIKFYGRPQAEYELFAGGSGQGVYAITNTEGQGVFNNINLPGKSGDAYNISLGIRFSGTPICSKPIKISISAPQPTPPDSEPIPTAAPGTTIGSGGTTRPPTIPASAPTSAGGDSCTDPAHPENPGFKTAIGCIHTNPAALIKDLLTFVIAISGGFAFLLMLLGAFGMITSAGNPESLQAGKDRFQSAIIGLLFVIFSVLLFQILGANILAIPGFK